MKTSARKKKITIRKRKWEKSKEKDDEEKEEEKKSETKTLFSPLSSLPVKDVSLTSQLRPSCSTNLLIIVFFNEYFRLLPT